MASAGPSDPGSFNRYAYVGGDPINWLDSQGMQKEAEPHSYYFQENRLPIDWSLYYYMQWLSQSSYFSSGGGGGGGSGGRENSHPVVLPKCEIDLYHQSALFEGNPLKHTLLKVTGVDGVLRTFEAGPVRKQNAALYEYPSWLSRLNDRDGGGNAYPTALTLDYSTGSDALECAFASKLKSLYDSFDDQRYDYGFPDHNSNSFTRSLVNASKLEIPFWVDVELGWIAPGWKNPLPNWP